MVTFQHMDYITVKSVVELQNAGSVLSLVAFDLALAYCRRSSRRVLEPSSVIFKHSAQWLRKNFFSLVSS